MYFQRTFSIGSGFGESVSNSVTDEIYADVSSGSNSKDYDHLYMSLRYGWNNDDEDAPGGNEASGAGASRERAGKIGTNAKQLSIKQLITLQKPADRMNMAKIKKGEGK